MSYAVEVYRSFGGASRPWSDSDLAREAAALRNEGHAVDYLGCVALPGDDTVFYLFEAPSREPVEEVVRRLGLTPERIVDAQATGFGGAGL